MADDPMAIEEAHNTTQGILAKAAAKGEPLDDFADDMFSIFLNLERSKISENNPDPPDVRDEKVAEMLNRVAASPAYRTRSN